MLLSRIVNSKAWQSQPTHVWERMFTLTYLSIVTFFAVQSAESVKMELGQVVSGIAIYQSYQTVTISRRLQEAQVRADRTTVDCYRKLTRITITRELTWVVAFTLLGAWTAMASVPLFLAYPTWRHVYQRARRPV